MINQAIATSPVVLFLGAGASSPLDKPLMASFVGRLRNTEPYRTNALFQWIVAKEPDLEFLLEELEDWKGKAYYGSRARGGIPTPIQIPGLPAASGPEDVLRNGIAELGRAASALEKEAKKEVFNEYREIKEGGKAVRLFEPLLGAVAECLASARSPLVIFTTNYDPAVETFCQARADSYRLLDGFVQQANAAGPEWHRESIDSFQPEAGPRRCIVLFKLHGSTSWFKRRPAPSLIQSLMCRPKPEATFIKSSVPLYASGDHGFENLLIYPAKRKVATEEPFFTAFDYFQRTLENAKLCVVIGYSFRDYDALSRLRSAARYNESLRLVVMDPEAEDLCKELRGGGVAAAAAPPPFRTFGVSHRREEYAALIRDALAASP